MKRIKGINEALERKKRFLADQTALVESKENDIEKFANFKGIAWRDAAIHESIWEEI